MLGRMKINAHIKEKLMMKGIFLNTLIVVLLTLPWAVPHYFIKVKCKNQLFLM